MTKLNFMMGIQGAVILVLRQGAAIDMLLKPGANGGPLAMLDAVFEAWAHGLLLVGLLREPRWRFLVTLWLYICMYLGAIHVMVTVVDNLVNPGGNVSQLALTTIIWLTWFNVYAYVYKDQRERDQQRPKPATGAGARRRQHGQSRRDALNGRPRGEAPSCPPRRDPLDHSVVLLVPSLSEPELRYVPWWEKELDTWRSIARVGGLYMELVG